MINGPFPIVSAPSPARNSAVESEVPVGFADLVAALLPASRPGEVAGSTNVEEGEAATGTEAAIASEEGQRPAPEADGEVASPVAPAATPSAPLPGMAPALPSVASAEPVILDSPLDPPPLGRQPVSPVANPTEPPVSTDRPSPILDPSPPDAPAPDVLPAAAPVVGLSSHSAMGPVATDPVGVDVPAPAEEPTLDADRAQVGDPAPSPGPIANLGVPVQAARVDPGPTDDGGPPSDPATRTLAGPRLRPAEPRPTPAEPRPSDRLAGTASFDTRPGGEPGPTIAATTATAGKPGFDLPAGGRPLGALADRVEAAVRALEQAPPPRSVTLRLEELDGIRLTVAIRSDGVHLSTSEGPAGLIPDLERALAARGFDLSGSPGDRRHPRGREERPDPGWRPPGPRPNRSTPRSGIQL